MFKVNNRNTRTRCEICSKLTIKTAERRHWRRSGVFIANFEHILHLVLVFLLLTLNMYLPAGLASYLRIILTHFSRMFQLYTLFSFLKFSGSIEIEHWSKMGLTLYVELFFYTSFLEEDLRNTHLKSSMHHVKLKLGPASPS